MNTGFQWMCGNDKTLVCKRHINNGAYGEMGHIPGISSSQPVDDRPFARKLIRVTTAIEVDVKNEVNVIDKLLKSRHRHIIQILNHGWLQTAGRVYFIDMELADSTLRDYIDYVFHDKDFCFPGEWFSAAFSHRECTELQRLQTTFEISLQVARGLEFLHSSGHVHRDIKPQNILYCRRENAWKLTDFGFTSDALSSAKTTVNRRGTPGYCAPELFNSQKPQFSNRSDIWALGCILHELATGFPVFANDFQTYQYALGSLELPIRVSYPIMKFWEDHISQSLRDLLSREASPRPDAREISRRMSAYERILEILNSDIATEYPVSAKSPYVRADGGPTVEFLLELNLLCYDHEDFSTYWSLLKAKILDNFQSTSPYPSSLQSVKSAADMYMLLLNGTTLRLIGIKLYKQRENDEGGFIYEFLRQNHARNVHCSLHEAAKHGDEFSIRSLAWLGGDVNEQDNNGETPMSYAVRWGRVAAIIVLEELGGDVNGTDNDGMSPLHFAARDGNVDAIRVLKELGADVNGRNSRGYSPGYLARFHGHSAAVALLKKFGGSVEAE